MQDFPEFHSWQSYYKQAGVRASGVYWVGGTWEGSVCDSVCVWGGGGRGKSTIEATKAVA